jgi:hypothetical protein
LISANPKPTLRFAPVRSQRACAAPLSNASGRPEDFKFTDIEGGFPHSEILGSKLVRSSPRHIAAYHVLHRLLAPRHPPDTLIALDCSHYRCPPAKTPRQRSAPAVASTKRQDTISQRPFLLRTYPGTERSSPFTAGEHDPGRHLLHELESSICGDPGSSGYVSSSRCLGTRHTPGRGSCDLTAPNVGRNLIWTRCL